MQLTLACPFEFAMELGSRSDAGLIPLHHESVGRDLGELVDETFVSGVLSGDLPADANAVRVEIRPQWLQEPLVARVEVELAIDSGSGAACARASFATGRWFRRSGRILQELREHDALAADAPTFVRLVAGRNSRAPAIRIPELQAPAIVDQSLDAAGVRALGAGELEPDRPVLIEERALAEILRVATEAGPIEAGGAVIGKAIRMPEPLPGTTTRIATLLTSVVLDPRHVGAPSRLSFSPEALAEAAAIADLRAAGECVLTAFHSHGWGTGCGQCNQNERCALPQCDQVSLDDYVVLESLFPSKATLMPIAGRKLGAPGQSPVLEIHAWRGGCVRPVRWMTYRS